MPSFHERLRAIRLKKGCTQAELAQAIGVTKSTMAKYDRGDLEPNIEKIKKIAQFLDVSPDYLLGADPMEKILRSCVEMIELNMIDKADTVQKSITIKSNALYNFFDTALALYADFDNSDEGDTNSIILYDDAVSKAIEQSVSDIYDERDTHSTDYMSKLLSAVSKKQKDME